MTAIVIVNTHEPDHEVAQRLLELAKEKGHDERSVEAVRGENDANLSFRVPDDVAEEFESDRAERWSDKIENDDDRAVNRPVAAINEDAVAAENTRSATDAAVAANNVSTDNDNASTNRPKRSGRAQTEQRQE